MNTLTHDPLATAAPAVCSTTDLSPAANQKQDPIAVEAAVTAFVEMAYAGVSTSVLAQTFGVDEATVRDLLRKRNLPAPGRAA